MVEIKFRTDTDCFSQGRFEIGQVLRVLAMVADGAPRQSIKYPVVDRDGFKIGEMIIAAD